MWPFKRKRYDIAIHYGYSHPQAVIDLDALGRPFVWVCGELILLLPGGKTNSSREWIPLSARALVYWAVSGARDEAA